MSEATNQAGREFVAGLATDGMTLAVGGLDLCDVPYTLTEGVRDSGAKDPTIVSNNMGTDGTGLGILLEDKQVAKVVASYVGENKKFARQYLEGEIEVEFTPQGTLAERLHAGGAGIPAFYTATSVDMLVAEGKPHVDFDGQAYVQERDIVANIGLVHAYHGDIDGNLVYRRTVQNFNPLCTASGKVTIAEVEHLLGRDEIDPDRVMTLGVYTQHIIRGDGRKKLIEGHTTRPRNTAPSRDAGDAAAEEEI